MSTPSPIPARIETVLQLFEAELRELAFPDLDRYTLASHAEAVRAQAAGLEEVRAMLEQTRLTLEARRAELLAHARKAVAYARVFASGDPALAARLEDIDLDEAPASKPRGRKPRKARADNVAELPLRAAG